MKRRLIVSGDDLGIHEAINRGVIEGHAKGIVTSASIVACGRAFEHACELLVRHQTLDLGVHLTLVEERPLLGVHELRTLAPDGRLPATYGQLFLRLLQRRIDLREIERELDAQIERALRAGLRISHLDSHQHTHFFPPLRPILFALAERHGISGLRAGARVMPKATKFSLLLGPLARRLASAARARGLETPDSLWLPSPSGHVDVMTLLNGIEALPEGVTEVVVHPGADQASLDREYPAWRFDWQGELSAVTAGGLRDALERNGVQLIGYAGLA